MSSNNAGRYSMLSMPVPGSTGTGLDQLVNAIFADTGLAGANTAPDLLGGAAAANAMNQIILEAAAATGAATDGIFTANEVVAMNAWIRTHRLTEWTTLHGDDEGTEETGFHRVQNDGGNLKYRGEALIDTVADGIYHLGFEIRDNRFVNEDGNANATVEQVAAWLTQFFTDHSLTGSGLDRITDLIMADVGLPMKTLEADIAGGADAANSINQLIKDGLAAVGGLDDGKVSTADVIALNAWIRADATRFARFIELHGDDENGSETGYHLVQNDGATTRFFGKNLVNTVADGIYHIGFQIVDGRFRNEDGDANATVSDVADWLNYFLSDASTTGTGLDRIVDTIKVDTGLARNTLAADIDGGAGAANALNALILEGIVATGAMADGWITSTDLEAINAWVRSDPVRLARFIELHGDDENGSETGYHLVQNDGANTNYFGQNLVNTVADGIYHFGFAIENGRFLNEDGDANATLANVASWLNYFIKGSTLVVGADAASLLTGTEGADQIVGQWNADTIQAGDGDDLINAGYGNDLISGGNGNDLIYGEGGDDTMDGGNGSDTYLVSGNQAGGWSSFAGFDTYADTGASGTDRIVASGADVDIGLRSFSAASSGIEQIDASGASGTVRLLGDSSNDTLDLRGVTLLGNIVIDGAYGNDKLYGNDANNTLRGGGGDDTMDGGNGSDTYLVSGNQAGGWSSFAGFDTYADTGASGTDRIVASGADVDIGLRSFSAASSGIEQIDASGASGTVRLLGDSSNDTLDLRGVTLLGNIVIDGAYGNDKLYGNDANNTLRGGGGDDTMDGGNGSDTYLVSGNQAGGWSSFAGFDTYADTGASGTDRIVASGADVDIGLRSFSAASSGIEQIDASGASGTVRLLGDSSNDTLDLRGVTLLGNIVIDGAYGNDKLYGNDANNTLRGGGGDDTMDGGNGSDTYLVSGNQAGGWSSFAGFDTYADTGASGTDRIVASGADVDIGLRSFSAASSGIEQIDASGASGTVRLLGDSSNDTLDLRGVTLLGNIVIDGAYGNDKLYGNDANNTLRGGGGDDTMDGGNGSDTYLVSGNQAGGWSSFAGFDTYADTGASGTDRIVASGADVDIGLRSFSAASSGIEQIDASGASGTVRLLGDSSNDTLDLRGVTLLGNIVIDGAYGNDKLYGNDANNTLRGGGGDDTMDGGNGSDTYLVSGNQAGGWSSFAGFDTYADTGASGTDRIVASGADVDIGLRSFSAASSGIEQIDASGASGTVRLLGDSSNDTLDLRGVTLLGNIVIDGAYGNDKLYGNDANNTLRGGGGDDTMDGGNGSDTYLVSGNQAGGWSSFAGFDTYADTGASGTDRIVASGADVDIGLRSFSAASSGIEQIDASGASGTVRLLGDSSNDTLDLRGVTLLGNIVIDGAYGNDKLYGNDANNTLRGGGGDDTMDGGNGSDTYLVSGNQAGGWSSFAGFDTYADTGASGTDRIVASGADVDIGLRSFSAASSGIEQIDASGASGTVRLLGDSSNDTLDLRGVTLLGNIVIDGAYGNDKLYGNDANNTLRGGGGDDTMDGGNGSDTYLVSGNQAGGWSSFAGFDTYADTGASGTDRIVASGADVDIGLRSFSAASSGIEQIDASGASGTVRLLGDSSNDTLDLRGVTLLGNIVIDGAYGNDKLYGNDANNTLRGGGGDDTMDGGNGSDTYLVSGNQAGGWSSFAGFDTYADTGASGTDRIVASGADVDIGLRSFSAASSGIEQIDASGASGTVRLLGDSSNDTLDLRGVTLAGNIVIDGAYGDDRLIGGTAGDVLRGGSGNDLLVGGVGQDSLDGGSGNDLLLGSQGVAGGRELYVGGAGSDRIALAHNDGTAMDIRGGSLSGKDGSADLITLVGTRGALAFSATVLDFEVGKDRIDLSQLRDAGNNVLAMDDLLISTGAGNTQIGFAAGVHAVDGGSIDVQITLIGVTGVSPSAFSFGAPTLPWGLAALDTALGYL